MIISRTPFRISFAGGGSDLRSFYQHEPGQVFSTSINLYLYVTVRRQLGLVEHKYRCKYSQIEQCDTVDEIRHPIIREALRLYGIDFPVEISTEADIPAHTGLGSSSAFAVGLLHALTALKGQYLTKSELARQAAHLEMDVLKRPVGKQDHYASAYGGLNVFSFNPDESVTVEPVFCRAETRTALERHLMLFYTGIKRDAAVVLSAQEQSVKTGLLGCLKDQVAPLREILSTGQRLQDFGKILREGWALKTSLSNAISCEQIDRWYTTALSAGAIGGKVLGAGGGGFLLFFVEPHNQYAVSKSLSLYRVPFSFDTGGSRITYYDQSMTGAA